VQGAATSYTKEQLKLEQVRRFSEEGLRYYEPHPKQLECHTTRAEERGLFGGNRSGKTYAGCMEMAWIVSGCHPYRRNYTGYVFGRDCCVDFDTINSVLLPTYKQLLPRKPCPLGYKTFEGTEAMWPGLRGGSFQSAYSAQDRKIYLENKSFIEFKSYAQGREAFQGATLHFIRHDEEPPEEIYRENLARQLTTRRNILFTLTPLNYSRWLYTNIYERSVKDEKIWAGMMSVYDNPFINEDVIRALESQISDPAELAARLRGEFTFLSGRVWKEYGEHNWVDWFRVPDEWEKTIILDPHDDKPTAVNWIAKDDAGRGFVYREADLTGDVAAICKVIKGETEERIDDFLIDPSSRRAHKIRDKGRLIDDFRIYLPEIREANNDTSLGRDRVRAYVKSRHTGPKFFVMKNCPTTHHQMKSYMWKPPLKSGENRAKPEVFKSNDDHPDCVRYWAMDNDPNLYREEFEGFGIGIYGNC